MSGFWLAAAALSLVALAILLGPLWSARRHSGRWSVTTLIAAVAVVPLALLVYSRVTTYDPSAAGASPSGDLAMVRQLANRLEEEPDDVEGWKLLGRSYMSIGEYGRARAAFTEAWNRSAQPDTALKLGLGEAMIWTEPASARARAGDLIEDVLAAEPSNQRALWWGGLVAAERDQPERARQRWTALLATNPPPDVANLLRQQLSLLPVQAGGSATARDAGPSAARDAAAATGPVLEVTISLAESLPVDRLGPQSRLFVYARGPGGGPPIAALRLSPSELPGTFTLSDSDAMIPGRSLGQFDELSIVARVAVGGDPIEQPGDFIAETTYRAGSSTAIELTIDRVVGAEE